MEASSSRRQFVNKHFIIITRRLGVHAANKKMKATRTHRLGGYTLVEIMIVVGIIGLLAAISIPNFLKSRSRSQATACINNLVHMDDAANEWALENGKRTGDPIVFDTDLKPYLKLNSAGQIPQCPANGTYELDTVGTNPTCSLSTYSPPHVMP